jgi:HPt (histidine-containing phosphotransfer) domain-containing protein
MSERRSDFRLPPEPEAVDLDQALARVGGDRELYYELLDMLVEDAPGEIGEMREAIGRGNAEEVERTAHSLKGAAANLGAGPLRDVALWLETLGRDGRLATAEAAVAELESELKRLHRFTETLE